MVNCSHNDQCLSIGVMAITLFVLLESTSMFYLCSIRINKYVLSLFYWNQQVCFIGGWNFDEMIILSRFLSLLVSSSPGLTTKSGTWSVLWWPVDLNLACTTPHLLSCLIY